MTAEEYVTNRLVEVEKELKELKESRDYLKIQHERLENHYGELKELCEQILNEISVYRIGGDQLMITSKCRTIKKSEQQQLFNYLADLIPGHAQMEVKK